MTQENSTIRFQTDDGETVELEVIEQTTFGGVNYLLVSEEDGVTAYILREVQEEGADVTYEIEEDEKKLMALSSIFEELLEDTSFEM